MTRPTSQEIFIGDKAVQIAAAMTPEQMATALAKILWNQGWRRGSDCGHVSAGGDPRTDRLTVDAVNCEADNEIPW